MSTLAAIHVAKKQLGLDDDTYRAVLVRVTGKDSTRAMSETERQRVVEEMRRRGFTKASNGARKRLQGRFAKKLQALWIAGWNLGIVSNRDDAVLIAFVKRQTGIDHVRFVHDPEDAAKAIEALKAWLEREGGVNWKQSRYQPDWTQTPGFRIALAQFDLLQKLDPEFAGYVGLTHWVIRNVEVGWRPDTCDEKQWIAIMNALGLLVRKVRKP